jgi:hypothetical protein
MKKQSSSKNENSIISNTPNLLKTKHPKAAHETASMNGKTKTEITIPAPQNNTTTSIALPVENKMIVTTANPPSSDRQRTKRVEV